MAPGMDLASPEGNFTIHELKKSINGHHELANHDSASNDAIDPDAQLHAYQLVSRFLPAGTEHEQFWWKLVGSHVATMMHEADYSFERQVQLLLFHRFRIIPLLGSRPTSPSPWFRSRVAPGAGDGTPIGYSWKWSVGSGKPSIPG